MLSHNFIFGLVMLAVLIIVVVYMLMNPIPFPTLFASLP